MDRIIHIIKKLSSEKYPELLVDNAVCYYEDHTLNETLHFLINEKGISSVDASMLVSDIKVEWIKIHRDSALIQAIVMFFMLAVFAGGIYWKDWLMILLGFIFGVLRIFSVASAIMEINKRKRDFLV
jgi:hypothetical protein